MIMDQKIFELGLSVEVVSVYLLCVGIAETDVELTYSNLAATWNGSEKDLIGGLIELEKFGILVKDTENNVKQMLSSDMWKF